MFKIRAIAGLTIILIFISGCKVFEGSEATKKEEKVKVNCYAADYKTTIDHFRATSSAIDPDETTARDNALLYAKKSVVSAINSVVLAASSRYIDQTILGKKQDFKEIYIPKINAKIKEVLNNELTDYSVICQEMTKLEDGNYQADISLEVNKRTIVDGINSRINSGSSYAELFDSIKFEQIFNEELEKVIAREKSMEENDIR